ncbi:permease-like cell division protein FtsX [Nocardioides terrisoli]|uniref:permease-like cell division protein FtsX n=1 Tax=Nocardioides terrisoli TaxID=3388267 RepID=UPI00287BB6CD|nr:permease-like cell division protein FtsX [Nocardioides marmorisolisilvae]
MALKYVFTEAGTGLRRNVSMSVALIVTIFVSLTLVGMGLLLNSQAHKAEQSWGSKLQITAFLCNQNSQSPNCNKTNVTAQQKSAIKQVLDTNPEVASYYSQTKQQAYDTWKKVYAPTDSSQKQIYSTVTPSDMQESYWIKLKDPQKFQGIESQLSGMQGVDNVRDLRTVLKPIYFWMTTLRNAAIGIAAFLLVAAILQVANTIRLAAFARRKEIGIMRLVGASTLYISLPFLMETLVAALIGIVLAGLTLSAFTYFVIYGKLRGSSRITEWIDWHDTLAAFGEVTVLGILLTLIPTLVMTRKYLKV